jgi:hypothetical protein
MSGDNDNKDCCGEGRGGEFSQSLVAYRSQSENHRVCDQSAINNLGAHQSRSLIKIITKDLQVGGNVESFDCVCTGGTSIRKQVLEKRSISGCSGKTVVKKRYNCENCSKDCEVNGHYKSYILVCCSKNINTLPNLPPYIPPLEYDQQIKSKRKVPRSLKEEYQVTYEPELVAKKQPKPKPVKCNWK